MSNSKHWMQTFTARAFKFDESHDLDITIMDIVRPLSLLPRFAGHASFHLTVAEHSLVVSKWVRRMHDDPLVQLHALLHDAHEAFTGDICTPFKRYLRDIHEVDIEEIQAIYQVNILAALGIPMLTNIDHVETINAMDMLACKVERDLFMESHLEWDIDKLHYNKNTLCGHYLRLSPGEAYELFLSQFQTLVRELDAQGKLAAGA